jgi:hypothetical protein
MKRYCQNGNLNSSEANAKQLSVRILPILIGMGAIFCGWLWWTQMCIYQGNKLPFFVRLAIIVLTYESANCKL